MLLAAATFTCFLSGCGKGLPEELKSKADFIPENIQKAKDRIVQKEKKYQQLTTTQAFKPVKKIAQRENWTLKFSQGKSELGNADQLYQNSLKPLLKQNKLQSAPAVRDQINRIHTAISQAGKLAQQPFSRYNAILATIKNADRTHKNTVQKADQIFKSAQNIKSGPVQKATKDFPQMTDKISERFSKADQLAQECKKQLDIVNSQYEKHTKGQDADYAAFTDSAKKISAIQKEMRSAATEIDKDIQSLYKSYSKILMDMKQDYRVVIKRESWNENADFYHPRFVTFQRQVTPEAYEMLTADNLDAIASISPGFTGSKFTNRIGNHWETLNINPTANWQSGHNAAEFWVESANGVYYHQYLLETDGKTKETGWEKVSEDVYAAALPFLGMAILAKPYGLFEADQLTQAAPPGMAYVGNPEYGQWIGQNDDNRFWEWYGKYAFFSYLFFPRPYYYPYHSWHGWRTHHKYRKPYFGKTAKGFQQFGSKGVFINKSSKFQASNFVKSGGFKSQMASVRGGGTNLRGGGPNSRGK